MRNINTNANSSEILFDPKYVNLDLDDYDNQKEVIESSDITKDGVVIGKDKDVGNYKPIDDRKDRYDPYLGYLHKTGNLENFSNVTQVIKYIDINSAFRSKTPYLSVDEEVFLDDNPITFTNESNTLIFSYPEHNLKIGDRIVINGVDTNHIKLRTMVNSVNTIEFTENSEYVAIRHEHKISSSYSDTYIKVAIDSVRSDTVNGLIGNIHINSINKTHIVYLTKPREELVDEIAFDPLKFYIKLPKKFSGSFSPAIYNFRIKYNSINGIPINMINANYPITANNLKGFHIVTDTTTDSFSISVFKKTLLSTKTITNGGDNISVGRINRIVDGYPESNNYTIPLPSTINNITTIRMISSEFPNSSKVFTSSNNKIYWQNIEDGDTVHSISITPGNYNSSSLITELEDRFVEVERDNLSESYEKNHLFDVTIDENTDRVVFKSYKKAFLTRPIIAVIPNIPTNPGLDGFSFFVNFELTINHPSHSVSIGDEITINGAIGHLGIPSQVLNNTHKVTEIVDDNTYKIILPKLNVSDERIDTSGGNIIEFTVPSIFRMRFDFDDTCGDLLGFRDVGESFAITPYATVNTNYDPYENDITTDELGNSIGLTNNFLKLTGFDYILMSIRNIPNISSLGKIKNVFGKVQLSGNAGETVYNSFIDCKKIFNHPITKLNELHFEFFTPDGDIVDFSGLDHSFTLEITHLVEVPKGTGISDNTSRYIEQSSRPLDTY